jgi:hypothetical protein
LNCGHQSSCRYQLFHRRSPAIGSQHIRLPFWRGGSKSRLPNCFLTSLWICGWQSSILTIGMLALLARVDRPKSPPGLRDSQPEMPYNTSGCKLYKSTTKIMLRPHEICQPASNESLIQDNP